MKAQVQTEEGSPCQEGLRDPNAYCPQSDRGPRRMARQTVVGAWLFGTVRTSPITSLDAGVPLRDVQEAASHADPRTTMRYDRARVSLDRHATYIVATFIAGASR